MVGGEEKAHLCDFVLEEVGRSQWVYSSYFKFDQYLVIRHL